MAVRTWLLLGAACTPHLDPVSPTVVIGLSAADLWDGLAAEGTQTTVGPLVVTSPRTADGRAFYAADPVAGPHASVEVRFGQTLSSWPPPVGTAFAAVVYVLQARPPIVQLRPSGLAIGDNDGAPAPLPYVPQSGLQNALVVVHDLTVTSVADPWGEADTDGAVGIGGRFGLAPGWGRTGDLVGILVDGRLSPRSLADWTGDWASDDAVATDLGAVRSLAEGTPVVVEDLVLATPWSRDGRWAVVQDTSGRGVWLENPAIGSWQAVAPGDVGTLTAEVRHTPDGFVLRGLVPMTPTGSRTPVVVALDGREEDGVLAMGTISDIGPPDAFGEREASPLPLDDRFTDLSDLVEPAVVFGAIRRDDAGAAVLAPLP